MANGPEGWIEEMRTWEEMDADDARDARDARPEAPAACPRCCGSSEELDPTRPGEFRICVACRGTGLRDPWRDPDFAIGAGVCHGCGISLLLTPEAGCCEVCDARLAADAEDDDPDPGDGGLGMPAWGGL